MRVNSVNTHFSYNGPNPNITEITLLNFSDRTRSLKQFHVSNQTYGNTYYVPKKNSI